VASLLGDFSRERCQQKRSFREKKGRRNGGQESRRKGGREGEQGERAVQASLQVL
jgi:hypothetical protein